LEDNRRDHDVQVEYALEHSALIKVSPVWKNYALGPSLGRGHFANVRRARRRAKTHDCVPEHVAIKVIDKARAQDPSVLMREVAFMGQLDHPNIIR